LALSGLTLPHATHRGGPICDDFGLSHSPPKLETRAASDALATVNRYVRLRLAQAKWKAFVELIAWPDEPGWDCNWVSSGYKVGSVERDSTVLFVPVTYQRLGLYCHDFDFKPENRVETIRYELVNSSGGWKIKAPEPEYPDVAVDLLIQQLQAATRDQHQTPEGRKQAEVVVRQLSALKSQSH
jgi:hypothetical protein